MLFLGVVLILNFEKLIKENMRNAKPLKEIDYKGSDNLFYCGKCHTRKQRVLIANGEKSVVPCLCVCAAERIKKEKARL